MGNVKRSALRVLVVGVLLMGLAGTVPAPAVRAADQVVTKAGDSGPGTLRQAIADVHPGGTITFDLPAYVVGIVLTSGELVIDQDLTIVGPGADRLYVSGDHSSRVFKIDLGTVTISGLTISNGEVVDWLAKGGGIFNNGDLTLREVTLLNNYALGESGGGSGVGGGVYSLGPLRVEDSLIKDNRALGGAGPGIYDGGPGLGAGIFIESGPKLTVLGSTLSGNLARGGQDPNEGGLSWGGAILCYLDGSVTLRDSHLVSNMSLGGQSSAGTGGEGRGGGIALTGSCTLDLEGGEFVGNSARGGPYSQPGNAYGGGIEVAGLSVLTATMVLFDGNTALGGGSGSATSGGVAAGGAIHNSGLATIINSQLDYNSAQGGDQGPVGGVAQGGAISASQDSVTIVQDCSLVGNEVSAGEGTSATGLGGDARGGALRSRGTLSLIRTRIADSVVRGGEGPYGGGEALGGGLYTVHPGTVTVKNSTLEGNTAEGGASEDISGGGVSYGGGACFKGAATVEASVFSDNSAQGGDSTYDRGGVGAGGGVWTGNPLIIRDSTVESNTAQGGDGLVDGGDGTGGGIQLGLSTALTMTGCLVADNLVRGGASPGGSAGQALGGGLNTDYRAWDHGTASITNSTFSGNETRSTFLGRGGGLHAYATTAMRLSFCTIVNNKADDEGGGIYSTTPADGEGPIIKNTIVGANTAVDGPQLYHSVRSWGYNLLEDLDGANLQVSPLPNTGEGNIIAPPKVGPLQDNGGPTWTHMPLGGADPSQAIDNGSATDIGGQTVNVDQRGASRPEDGDGDGLAEHDIGAVELEKYPYEAYLPMIVRP